MLDIKFIRQNSEKVKEGCQKKQVKVDIGRLLELDKKRREYLKEIEDLRAEQNKISSQGVVNEQEKEQAKEIKEKIKTLEKKSEEIEKQFNDLMLLVPNLPLEDVPVGESEKDNVVLREVGEKPKFSFKPKDYLEIAEKLDLIDMKRAAKVSGTRFGYLKKEAALLEFALIGLALDFLTKESFIPVVPPVMIKPEMARAMGYPEQFDGQEAYYIEKDNLYLIGTAEQCLGPMHANEILNEKELPKRYFAFPSTSFRREAGAYGKDTKGIFRVHQFDKIEMFSFSKPEDSKKEHQFFLEMEEKLMQALKIPYRIVQMCTGDLGFPTAAKYDIEAWMPSQERYRETHSTSNCTDFQARRLNIRYKATSNPPAGEVGKQPACRRGRQEKRFVHTINGTAFAIGRTLIAIIENYQQEDGSIKVPEVLQKYVNFKSIKGIE